MYLLDFIIYHYIRASLLLYLYDCFYHIIDEELFYGTLGILRY